MRIHFIIEFENKKAIEFWISNFPEVPRVGDLIAPEKMVFQSPKEVRDALKENVYKIESITWDFDADGYFVLVFLNPT